MNSDGAKPPSATWPACTSVAAYKSLNLSGAVSVERGMPVRECTRTLLSHTDTMTRSVGTIARTSEPPAAQYAQYVVMEGNSCAHTWPSAVADHSRS